MRNGELYGCLASSIVKSGYVDRHSFVVIDVGARDAKLGYYKLLGNVLKYIGFDPDEKECERLNQLCLPDYYTRFFPYAVSGISGTQNLFVTEDVDCSSLLEPNPGELSVFGLHNKIQIKSVQQINTISLSEFLEKEKIEFVSHLKLDIQGAELCVLEGLKNKINDIWALEVEVEFIEVYKNQPRFSEIDSFLRSRGFILFNFVKKNARANSGIPNHVEVTGRAVWGDAFYIQNPENLFTESDVLKNFKKAIATLLFFERYRSPDFVLFYLSKIVKSDRFTIEHKLFFKNLLLDYKKILSESEKFGLLSRIFYFILSRKIFKRVFYSAEDAINRINRSKRPEHLNWVWPDIKIN